jgi:hypothetical protein
MIGEILFSLQYLPAAKRLAISIIKGKGFGPEGSSKKLCKYKICNTNSQILFAKRYSSINYNMSISNDSYFFNWGVYLGHRFIFFFLENIVMLL